LGTTASFQSHADQLDMSWTCNGLLYEHGNFHGVTPNHPSHGRPWLCIETHDDPWRLAIPHFKRPLFTHIFLCIYHHPEVDGNDGIHWNMA
jgi:hypothetical protein